MDKTPVHLSARAKINLCLYVLGKREDGYHDLELVFQPVSLADDLLIRENAEEKMVFTCSVPAFENPENLVCRGYQRMRELFPGRIPGLTVHLVKKIPSGAGMGGGSTDCSALLVWLNQTYSLGLSLEELIRIGAGLGADVPACMIPRASRGRGIGERLTQIRTGLRLPLLVVKPDVSFPTGEMYRRVDEIPFSGSACPADAMVEALEKEEVAGIVKNLYNVFEEVVPAGDVIRCWKHRLIEAGAAGALMTGSGSAVFGIFRDERSRDMAADALGTGEGYRVYRCETVNEP